MWAYTGEESASSSSSSFHDENKEQTKPEVRYVVKVKTILDLPLLVVDKIFSYFTYAELAELRHVNTQFDKLAQTKLNKGFEKLGKIIETRKIEVKRLLPKRQSERRNHRLTKFDGLYISLSLRYELLDMTYKTYLHHPNPKLRVCFTPGKVIDEFHRVLNVIQRCRALSEGFTGDSSELLLELRDLSSMAMEYFEEKIRPELDEYAEKERSYFSSNLKKLCCKNHDSETKPLLEIVLNRSPAPHKVSETMQDEMDEQQGIIDAQQDEINILKNTVVNTLQFLKLALPNHSYEMKRRFENNPMFKVNTQFDELAKKELDRGFKKVGGIVENCKNEIKKKLPKRHSERRNHRLTKISEVYSSFYLHYSIFDLTYKKYMKHSHPKLKVCFTPGKVTDEFFRVLNLMKRFRTSLRGYTGDSFELLQELKDLTSMARDYFEEHIQPRLDEYAQKEGINLCSRKWNFNFDVEKYPKLGICSNQSPAPLEHLKTRKDKIEELQKTIDAQQADITILKDTVVGILQLLESALPNHGYEMKKIFGNNPMFNKMKNSKESQPSTSQTNEKVKKRLFGSYEEPSTSQTNKVKKRLFGSDEDSEKWFNQPSTSTAQSSKKMKFVDSTSEESNDYGKKGEKEEEE